MPEALNIKVFHISSESEEFLKRLCERLNRPVNTKALMDAVRERSNGYAWCVTQNDEPAGLIYLRDSETSTPRMSTLCGEESWSNGLVAKAINTIVESNELPPTAKSLQFHISHRDIMTLTVANRMGAERISIYESLGIRIHILELPIKQKQAEPKSAFKASEIHLPK